MSARTHKRPYKLKYECLFVGRNGYMNLGGKGERYFVNKRAAIKFARLVGGLVVRELVSVNWPILHRRKYRRRAVEFSFASPEILEFWFETFFARHTCLVTRRDVK